MSRVGRRPIPIPSDVRVTIDGSRVTVVGPKGELTGEFSRDMCLELREGSVRVGRPSNRPLHRSLHGLTRSLIANMVEGVTRGFERSLEIQGVGYRAEKRGKDLILQVGFSHPITVPAPKGIEFVVDSPTTIRVRGTDKRLVGEVAAEIRRIRPPEPYKGKGIRYVGEHVRRKTGKSTVTGPA